MAGRDNAGSLWLDRIAKPLGQFPLLLLPILLGDRDGFARIQPFEQERVDL